MVHGMTQKNMESRKTWPLPVSSVALNTMALLEPFRVNIVLNRFEGL